jgi:hypothetical protein
MNVDELKPRAVSLEQELFNAANQSLDVAAFAKYEPLLSVIKRAKAGEIAKTEELPGMRYWMYETDIPKFPSLEKAFSRFSLLLSGWER